MIFSDSDYVWPILVEDPEHRGKNTSYDRNKQGKMNNLTQNRPNVVRLNKKTERITMLLDFSNLQNPGEHKGSKLE